MAGAFTHFLICDEPKKRRFPVEVDLLRFGSKYSEFVFLGAASPDLPYLSFKIWSRMVLFSIFPWGLLGNSFQNSTDLGFL